jgi:hypothetical protein
MGTDASGKGPGKESGSAHVIGKRSQAVIIIIAILTFLDIFFAFKVYGAGTLHHTATPQGGSVTVLTSDSNAQVSIENDLSTDFIYGGPPPLDLIITITSHGKSQTSSVGWVVDLDGDAAMPYASGTEAFEGNALPQDSRRKLSEVWVQGASQAYFIREGDVDWDYNSPDSVLYGTANEVKGSVQIQIIGPTRGPLLTDNGEDYSMYFPKLGVLRSDNAEQAAQELSSYYNKVQRISPAQYSDQDGTDTATAKKLLFGQAWYFPKSYALTDWAFDNADEDRLIFQNQTPQGLTDWRWTAKDSMTILAVAERPSAVIRDQHDQFWAAFLFGLLGGLVLWWVDFIFSLTSGERKFHWRSRPSRT